MSVEIGQQISHYKILKKLGEGGMGVVYKAHDTILNRPVALKFLPAHLTKSDENRKRFVLEAQSASALDHTNICNIHEIGESNNELRFICMAYYEGESLRERIERGPVPLDEAIIIIKQIAKGLEAAHEAKIIHRDIKPGNIFITNKSEVKILDFGLAKLAGADLSKTTSSRGTAAYMCPEQIRGEKFDQRCDIWALGVVFFEMLTGRLPFDGDYPESVMYSIVNKQPKSLSDYLENAPDIILAVVLKLLEKDPRKRYQTTTELIAEIQNLDNREKSIPINEKPLFTLRLLRKKSFLYGTIITLIIIIVLAIGWGYLHLDSKSDIRIAVIPIVSITDDAEDWLIYSITDALVTSLAQISALRVLSFHSSIKYLKTNKTRSQIAEELDINYLVEQSIIKSGNHVKITARLCYALEDGYIWAESFDGDLREYSKLISKVSESIAKQIKAKFTLQDQEKIKTVYQANPEALELYWQGSIHLDYIGQPDIYQAIDFFVESIQSDSNFAKPYIGLSACYGMLTYWGELSWEDGVEKIRRYINKALELDHDLMDTYSSLGAYRLWQEWDWDGAGEAFEQAKKYNPNITGFGGAEYVWYLLLMGNTEEAVEAAQKLFQVDPLYYTTRYTVFYVYYCTRQFNKAIEFCKRSIQLDPKNIRTYQYLAMGYDQLKNYDDAHESRLSFMEHSGQPDNLIQKYDSLYQKLGHKAYPTWILQRDEDWLEKNPTEVSWSYANLGQLNEAFKWLEKAFKKRDGRMVQINADPKWDIIRDEPRFRDIVTRMKFPD